MKTSAISKMLDHGRGVDTYPGKIWGDTPESEAQSAAPGRFTVVSSDGHKFLYIPEIQQLCDLSSEVADTLDAVASSDRLDLLGIARGIVADLAIDMKSPPLTPAPLNVFGLRDVVVHVSQLCNMECTYCYAEELNKVGRLMSPSVADNVVARTMLMAPDGLSSVKFLGGEPTLAWPIIVQMVEQYEAMAAHKRHSAPGFVIVTNGTKITDAMIAFMVEHAMYVLVSLDGSSVIHNVLRPLRGGRGTYDAVSTTLSRMVQAGVNVAIEGVYTKAHHDAGVTVCGMMDHYMSLGIRHFQITLALGTWHGADSLDHLEDVIAQFSDAARASMRSFRSAQPFLLRGIQFVLDGFSLRERNSHVCGAGRSFMAVNHDGEAFPCYLLESAETSYGFVDTRWDPAKYGAVSERFVRNGKAYHKVCRECWANEICQSCLGSSFLISPEITKPPAWFCKLQKQMIAAVLGEIAGARASVDWPLFMNNMKRHLAPITGSE